MTLSTKHAKAGISAATRDHWLSRLVRLERSRLSHRTDPEDDAPGFHLPAAPGVVVTTCGRGPFSCCVYGTLELCITRTISVVWLWSATTKPPPLSPLGVRTSRTNKAAVLVNPCPIDAKGRRTFLEPPKEALCMYAFPCLQCSCLSRSLLRPEPLFFAFLFVSLSFHPSSQLPLRGPLPCFLPGVLSELSFFLLTSLSSAYHAYRVSLPQTPIVSLALSYPVSVSAK